MKKLILFTLLFLSLVIPYNTYAVLSNIGTFEYTPVDVLKNGEDDLFFLSSREIYNVGGMNQYEGVALYDKSNNLIKTIVSFDGYPLSTYRPLSTINQNYLYKIESTNNIFYYGGTSGSSSAGPYRYSMVFKYNKTTNTWSDHLDWGITGGRTNGGCLEATNYAYPIRSCSPSHLYFIMEGENLIISAGTETKFSLNVNNTNDDIDFIPYTGNILLSDMEQIDMTSYLNVGTNYIQYINKSDKTYNTVFTDIQGDKQIAWTGFATTYNINYSSIFYDSETTKSYISFGGDNENMRSYSEFEVTETEFEQDKYFRSFYSGALLHIGTASEMGYDYNIGRFGPIIELLNIGGDNLFYYVDSNNNLYKDTEIDTTGFIFNISSSSGGYTPGIVGTGVVVDSSGSLAQLTTDQIIGDNGLIPTELFQDYTQWYDIYIQEEPLLSLNIPYIKFHDGFHFKIEHQAVVLPLIEDKFGVTEYMDDDSSMGKSFISFILGVFYIFIRLFIIALIFFVFRLYFSALKLFIISIFGEHIIPKGKGGNVWVWVTLGTFLIFIGGTFYSIFQFITPFLPLVNDITDKITIVFSYINSSFFDYGTFRGVVNAFFLGFVPVIISYILYAFMLHTGKIN